MNVLIVDYGMGNIGSVRRAIQVAGGVPLVTEDPADIEKASKIILPGVGAFPDGMSSLVESGWAEVLQNAVLKDGKGLLGICLGMQLLATYSYEGKKTKGLNLIEGVVKPLKFADVATRIPHVGWNEIDTCQADPLLAGVSCSTDCYFVHSFYFVPDDYRSILATTTYCDEFASIVRKEKVYGVQFHPEKSSKAGGKIIENFLRL